MLKKLLPVTLSIALLFAVNPALTVNAASISVSSTTIYNGIFIITLSGNLFTATGSADGDEHYKYHDGDAAILQGLQDNIKINGISVSTLRAQGRSIAVNSTVTNQIRITKGDDCYTASPYLSSLSSVTIELDAPYIGNTGNILQELSEVWSPNTVSLSSSMNYNGIPIFTLDYIGDMVASRITDLAEIIKYYSDSAYTTMFNYGYFYELWDAESGHYALNSVLDCPFIDFLAAPITYEDRGYRSAFVQPDRKAGSNLGTTSGYMSPVDAVTKAGKIWMQESDQMTFIKRSASLFMDETDALNMFGWLDNLGEVYEGHRREMGLSMIHGTGMWPMELRGEGWHDDPKIWQNYHRLQSLGLQYAKTSKTEASFEAAIVTDESAEGISRQNTETIRKLMSNTRFSANRAGTSISFVSLEDVA